MYTHALTTNPHQLKKALSLNLIPVWFSELGWRVFGDSGFCWPVPFGAFLL